MSPEACRTREARAQVEASAPPPMLMGADRLDHAGDAAERRRASLDRFHTDGRWRSVRRGGLSCCHPGKIFSGVRLTSRRGAGSASAMRNGNRCGMGGKGRPDPAPPRHSFALRIGRHPGAGPGAPVGGLAKDLLIGQASRFAAVAGNGNQRTEAMSAPCRLSGGTALAGAVRPPGPDAAGSWTIARSGPARSSPAGTDPSAGKAPHRCRA